MGVSDPRRRGSAHEGSFEAGFGLFSPEWGWEKTGHFGAIFTGTRDFLACLGWI